MVGRSYTVSRLGMNCSTIEVEVDIKNGLPNITLAGLLSQEVREAKDRVRAAIQNSGLAFPLKRVTINLSPAETIKTGTHYDLAIAIAVLKANMEICGDDYFAFFGELNLSGEVKWIRGILPMITHAIAEGFKKIFIPYDNYYEARFLKCDNIVPVKSLFDIVNNSNDNSYMNMIEDNIKIDKTIADYSDIVDQKEMIEAFKIAASGNHHMLLVGPPGSGKTMASSRMPGIIPDLEEEEIIEINKIYSIASSGINKNWISKRPFRTPHNSASTRAIIGGGPKVLPGEISLAHKGILFLDEFLEFRIDTLQALRTVIEKKEVYISLRNGCAVYPADFLLIAASNPCPCGFYDTSGGICSCSIKDVKKYRRKLKNPLIDRIDLQVKVDRINYKNLTNGKKNQTSDEIKEEVMNTRNIQNKRFENENFKLNSCIPAEKINQYCKIDIKGDNLLEKIADENLLTARACHKILRIARTIADLNSHDIIQESDIIETLKYRFLDVELCN
jgi:magnesium chelatase family protein